MKLNLAAAIGLNLALAVIMPSSGALSDIRTSRRERYDGLIAQYSSKNHLRPRFVKALIMAESDFDHKAESRVGALGLMQLMPDTAGKLGVHDNLRDPEANIRAGTAFLRDLYRSARIRYGLKEKNMNRAPVWVQRRILAAYHAGPRMMFRDKWPKSTTAYVGKVMRYSTNPTLALNLRS